MIDGGTKTPAAANRQENAAMHVGHASYVCDGKIHRHRINRAVNFAERYCGEEIDLGKMADVACLSKYHFLRVFKLTIGETPGRFLQRIRLERAARQLVFLRRTPIGDIALDCGFGSPQSFSCAFQNRFGFAPRQYRKENVFRFQSYWQNDGLSRIVALDTDRVLASSNVRIQERSPARVAYIRHVGPYGNGGIGKLFVLLRAWARRSGLPISGRRIIGVPWDNPNVTPPTNCRYDVCVEVPEHTVGDELVSIQMIPGGTYAVMPVREETMNIRHAWEVFAKVWLPVTDYLVDFRAGYEVHDPSCDGLEHFCRTIWLPVRRP